MRSSCWPRSTHSRARARTSSASASASRIFRHPRTCRTPAIRAIKGGKHGYTPSAGIDELRAAAATYMGGLRGGLPIRAEDVVVGAGRQAIHRLRDPLDHRLRRGRRGDLSESGLPDLRIADHGQRRGAGADSPARSARLRLRPGRARAPDHAAHQAADPELPRTIRPAGCCRARISRRSRRSCESIPRSGSTPTRSTRALRTRASSSRLRSCPACTSARSSPTARRRPGR